MPFDGTEIETVAARMRALFANGKHWGRGSYFNSATDKYCLMGAFRAVVTNKYRARVYATLNIPELRFLKQAAGLEKFSPTSVEHLNDRAQSYKKDILPILRRMEDLEIAAKMAKLKIKIGPALPLPKAKKRALVTA